MRRTTAFFRRLGVMPLEAAIAGWAFFGGLFALLHFTSPEHDALSVLLPGWLDTANQVANVCAGITWIAGLGTGRAKLTATGLILVATSVSLRFIALLAIAGPQQELLLGFVFYASIVWSIVVRVRSIFRGEVIVRASGVVEE